MRSEIALLPHVAESPLLPLAVEALVLEQLAAPLLVIGGVAAVAAAAVLQCCISHTLSSRPMTCHPSAIHEGFKVARAFCKS